MGHYTVLYIGSLETGSNSYRRFQALSKIVKRVDSVDTEKLIMNSFYRVLHYHLNRGPGIVRLNRKVRLAVAASTYDIIWVDNKTYLTPATLRFIKDQMPAAKIINVLTDDPFGKYGKHWKLLKRTIKLFDCFFVQRKVNINEFLHAGAKRVETCYRSFDPCYNRPLEFSGEDKKYYEVAVGFTGTYENVRAGYIAYLIKNGINVTVTGNGWPGGEFWDTIRPFYKGPSIYGDAYIKSICGMHIALHFLRHANRDEQDSRTFEIPACRAFMIAERSDLHLELFSENKEAVYFSTKEELFQKVQYYLSHPLEANAIAEAGYQRCIRSGYTHEDRLLNIINSTFNG